MARTNHIAAVLASSVLLVPWTIRPAVADACLVPLGPQEQVTQILDLASGSKLVLVFGGTIYRVDSAGTAVTPITDDGVVSGRVETLFELPDGRILVVASDYARLAVLGPDAEALEVFPLVSGMDVWPESHNRVEQLVQLPHGRVLVGSSIGLFVLDPSTNRIELISGDADFSWDSNIFVLSQDTWLIQNWSGLFIYNPTAQWAYRIPNGDELDVRQVVPATDTTWYLLGKFGVYQLRGRTVSEVITVDSDQELEVSQGFIGLHALPGGDWLIGGDQGIFRYSRADGSASRLDLPDAQGSVLSIRQMVALPDGGVLAIGVDGVYRVDNAGATISELLQAHMTSEPAAAHWPGGGWLVGTDDGAFLVDANGTIAARIEQLGDARIDQILTDGSDAVMIRTGRLLYRVREGPSLVELTPGPETKALNGMALLPGGRLLLGAENGLYATVADFSNLTVTLDNASGLNGRGPDDQVRAPTEWTLRGGCAPAAEHLGLVVDARNLDQDGLSDRAEPLRVTVAGESSKLVANVAFPTAGRWSLQLVSTASGVDRPLGAPATVAVDASVWDTLQRIWEWIAGAVGSAYVSVFALLFLLAHRTSWAFRILSDPVWSRLGIWPFFLIRHWPPAQRWVLEPWFQAMRRKPWPDTQFYDAPVTGPDGETIDATALLGRLRSESRLWLQGNAGMGKSTVFEQWERACFATGPAHLPGMARQFGFVLITVPVRHVARLPVNPNHPELWVVDAVQRRLQRFGMPIDDLDLVKAMLRAGGFALVLDGMNEADRDDALVAFANAFPKVPLLATSQNDGPDSFHNWHLPPDISTHMDRLLLLWLGETTGAALAGRIRRDEIGAFLRSGYDLRLVVDLAGAEPETATLPTTRAGLYRAVLARVRDGDTVLAPVKKLAWTMVIDGRREIRHDDLVEAIGEQLLDALEAAHVLRLVAEVYEFRHDQMRAFLAALWLVEETPSTAAIAKRLADRRNDGRIWRCSRRDQEELWRFVADLLATPEDRALLWTFALDDPERGFLQVALKARADAEGQVMATSPALPADPVA